MKKRLLCLLCALLLVCSVFALSACKDNNQDDADSVKTAPAYVTLDINPSIELTVDANGIVASVYGANEDGQILLYEEAEKIIGLTYEEAVKYITKLAADLDYLTTETEEIRAFVTSVDVDDVAEIEEKLSASIKAAAQEKGITVSVTDEESLELICDLADADMFRQEMQQTFQSQQASGVLHSYHFVPQERSSVFDLILPLLIVGGVLLLLWFLLMGRLNGGGNPMSNFGKARTVLGVPDGKKVTFDDVAGADDADSQFLRHDDATVTL